MVRLAPISRDHHTGDVLFDSERSSLSVLDLCDERGEVAAYLLADLGAHVVKPVPPDVTDSDRFRAYNTNKQLLFLTGVGNDDRAAVLSQVETSDVVFVSAPDGLAEQLSLRHEDFVAVNPTIVTVVVSPFGVDGPRADQPASELTIGALGGIVRIQGTPERAPVQFSIPQVWRHAGAEAAVGAMVGLRRSEQSGDAQFVDVSAQAAATWTMLNAMEASAIQGYDFERAGSILPLALPVRILLEAADGYVITVPTGRIAGSLHGWLQDEGLTDERWEGVDWATFDHRVISGEPTELPIEAVSNAIIELCRRYRRQELFDRGLTLGVTLAPVNSFDDLLSFEHFPARQFWESGETAIGPEVHRIPGAFYRIDEQRPVVARGLAGAQTPPRPTAPSIADEPPELPFTGLKVLDFSWIGVGPITAKAFADHGATVIRVESETRLDGLRRQTPFKDDEFGFDRSHFFGTFNSSKYGVTLDLKNPAGIEIAKRMAAWADVVIESFTPGSIDRLGLGYEQLKEINPSVIMVSTSLLGKGSPYEAMGGYGYHASAVTGFYDLVGWPDLPPDGPWVAYTDTIAPRFITPTIMAALRRRDRDPDGVGCHIDVAQAETALQFMVPELIEYQRKGKAPGRLGNRSREFAPQGVYPCQGTQGWLALTIADDQQWQRLVAVLDHPVWATDPSLANAAGRHAAHDTIDEHLSQWTARHEPAVLEALLREAGIPAGMLSASSDLLEDPQYRHRNFYRWHEHSVMGEVPYAGHQYRVRGYDSGPRFAAPTLGEHTFEVLTDIIGLTPDEVAEAAIADALR